MEVNPTTYPIAWFRDRSIDGSLIIRPPYQRKPVWTKDKKTFLIDTILKGYHLPEVYLHRVTSARGKNTYNVIDGQQRIRTILEFIDNKFSLPEEEYPEYVDLTFDDLPEKIRESFWGYTVYAREISDATENDVRELFKRMNKNVVSLNAQELRHATYSGTFIKYMEELADDPFWTENKIVSPNDVRRMNDVQFVSELFIALINGVQDKTKDLEKFYELYEDTPPELTPYKERFLSIKQFISDVLPDLRETRWKNDPDFYTLFLSLNRCLAKKKLFTVSEKNKKSIKNTLVKFAEDVSKAVNVEGQARRLARNIRTYVNAITRATSDKKNRIVREEIVFDLIKKYF